MQRQRKWLRKGMIAASALLSLIVGVIWAGSGWYSFDHVTQVDPKYIRMTGIGQGCFCWLPHSAHRPMRLGYWFGHLQAPGPSYCWRASWGLGPKTGQYNAVMLPFWWLPLGLALPAV